jgi:hypothetical protein
MAIGRIPEPGTGIPESIVDAKGDIVTATAADTPARLAVGTNDQRLVAASGEATGLKYVSDTQNTVVDAKGDLIVGTAADTVARLAVGTNGHTLVADSAEATGLKWQAASSGALTKIASASFTTQSSVSITGCFSSTYKSYIAIWQAFSSAAAADLQIQFLYSTSTAQTTEYYGSGFGYNNGNALLTYGFNNTSQGTIYNDLGTASTYESFGQINFDGVNGSSGNPRYFGNGYGSGSQANINYSGLVNVSRTYTGFLLKPDSGTITGRYQVYGLAD